MAGNYRESSPVNVVNLSGERNPSYRRSMKRKIEPRVSREKRNFTIDRFERVAFRLRGLWNPCLEFRSSENDFGIEIESKLDQIYGSGIISIYGSIYFRSIRLAKIIVPIDYHIRLLAKIRNQCNVILSKSFRSRSEIYKSRFHTTLTFLNKFLYESLNLIVSIANVNLQFSRNRVYDSVFS